MPVYLKIVIYLISFIITFPSVYQIDFNKFMRINKAKYAILVWIVISLALGYLIGSLFVEFGSWIQTI